ncbi:MAG: hypothetical protein MJ117_00825 [Lachnospiraceae bacterium]|nr:hypothetical protein [Lachnospiraceae bacterium]
MEYIVTWLDKYYHETEQEDREEILEEGIKEEGLTKENELRQKLWDLRYKPTKKERGKIDHYFQGILTLEALGRKQKSFWNTRFIKNEIETLKKVWGIELAEEYGEMGQAILKEEMKHLARTYIGICRDDKNFSGMIMGIGKMSKEKLTRKIADQVYQLAVEIPKMHHLEDMVQPFSTALIDVYFEMYPKKADRRVLQERLDGNKSEESNE